MTLLVIALACSLRCGYYFWICMFYICLTDDYYKGSRPTISNVEETRTLTAEFPFGVEFSPHCRSFHGTHARPSSHVLICADLIHHTATLWNTTQSPLRTTHKLFPYREHSRTAWLQSTLLLFFHISHTVAVTSKQRLQISRVPDCGNEAWEEWKEWKGEEGVMSE